MKNTRDREQDLLMGYLQEHIDNLCELCISDRMTNVLSPKCRRRFLINLRILAGAEVEELPNFCYNQVVSNIKRYIGKKTTLFTPVDSLIFNEDLFELFFPKISKKMNKICSNSTLNDDDIKEINNIITKSKIPAVYSKNRKDKPGLLKNILKKDKMIKEGSFIYDISPNFLIIWYNNSLYVTDFKKGFTICNAHKEKIDSFEILERILPLYAEGKEFHLKFNILEEGPQITIRISGKKLIKINDEVLNQRFVEITDKIGPKFPRATFYLLEDSDLGINIEVNKKNTYDDINYLFNKVSTLSEIENINLLEDIK